MTNLPEPMKWWGWGDESIDFDISKHPVLWNYLAPIFKLTGDERTAAPVSLESIDLPAQKTNPELLRELVTRWGADRVTYSKRARLTHAFGKSLRDLWRLRNGIVRYAPDYVVYPTSHDEVRDLVDLAAAHGAILIPFGGGSNIAGCLEPAHETKRTVVCVDLRLMNRLLELDEESGIARFEAGVMGPDLEATLNRTGFTLGHFPDSFKFSTLGGWVATRSAGMQSDRYGKIEDMVLAIRMTSPAGTIETRTVPKASNGISVNHLCIGSEGALGIITEIVVRVHRRPSRSVTYGYLFPDFPSGAEAMRECHRMECVPTMSRLNDAARTALSFAYRSKSSLVQHQLGQLLKFYIRQIRRIDFARASLMLATFEGDAETFGIRRKRSESIYRRFGAVPLGDSPGRGFQSGKYDFPYLRDFLLDRGVLADVSETSTNWSNLLSLHGKCLSVIQRAIDSEGIPGTVGCHISHSYDSGASLYFTFGFAASKTQEMAQYLRIKKAAQDSFLDNGATVSHHHAVGYEHLPWLERDISSTGLAALESLKSGLDPDGMMNPGKLSRGFGFDAWFRK